MLLHGSGCPVEGGVAEQLVEMVWRVRMVGGSVSEERSETRGGLRKGRSVMVGASNNGSGRIGKSLLLWWNPSLLLSN